MIIIKPTLQYIEEMRKLVAPQVQSGIILDRSVDVMANMIRSYRVAFCEKDELDCNCISLDSKSIDELKSPIMLGFCALHIHSLELAEIRSLIVAPFAQRKGVATHLINDCINEALLLGIKEVLVLTYKKELFQKLGFIEISKDKIPNHKIWADCIACKHFPLCDEIALIKNI